MQLIRVTNQFSTRTKLHFSKKPINHIYDDYFVDNDVDLKPYGLWYSWGNEWVKFLHYPQEPNWWSNKRLQRYKYVYKLKIDYKKVLRIRTIHQAIAFTEVFGIHCSKLPKNYKSKTFKKFSINEACKKFKYPYLIKWNEVYDAYSGIDIPYNNTYKDLLSDILCWYSSWDISSGCIWNKQAINKLTLIHPS